MVKRSKKEDKAKKTTKSKKTAKAKVPSPKKAAEETSTEEKTIADTNTDMVEEAETDEQTSYDVVPYESYPYPMTHPTHLKTIATIFGVETPDLNKARVLELGCAGGGNLMPLAVDYPDAEFVGIDLSKEQIDRGNEHVNAMGIKNLTLEHLDISKFDESRGKFDYIICHGVFSWVPDEVADKILEICEKQLTETGVAIISYNVLPGWASVRSVRDMLLFHTARFKAPEDKVKQARLLLQFMTENTPKNSPYQSILENEKNILGRTNSDYILHEYLEDVNKQYYFHEFMSMALKHNLQYLGDSNLSSMYAGNMPKDAAEKLRAVNNIIEQEQYMDYIRNRRFRYTILTHKDREIVRKIDTSVIFDLFVSSEFQPQGAISNDNAKVQFVRPAQKQAPITISDAGTKAVFAKLAEAKGKPCKIGPIAEEVAKEFGLDLDTLKNSLASNVLRLVLNGLLRLSHEEPNWTSELTDTPEVYSLARYQGSLDKQTWVTNTNRRRIRINRMSGEILSYADGSTTTEQIIEKLEKFMEEKELKIMNDGKEVTDPEVRRKSVETLVSNTLKDAANKGLLVK